MVNAFDFLSNNQSLEENIKTLFPHNANDTKVKLVRIACHLNEFLECFCFRNFKTKRI